MLGYLYDKGWSDTIVYTSSRTDLVFLTYLSFQLFGQDLKHVKTPKTKLATIKCN